MGEEKRYITLINYPVLFACNVANVFVTVSNENEPDMKTKERNKLRERIILINQLAVATAVDPLIELKSCHVSLTRQ